VGFIFGIKPSTIDKSSQEISLPTTLTLTKETSFTEEGMIRSKSYTFTLDTPQTITIDCNSTISIKIQKNNTETKTTIFEVNYTDNKQIPTLDKGVYILTIKSKENSPISLQVKNVHQKAPKAPSNFYAKYQGKKLILTWNDNANNEEGFMISDIDGEVQRLSKNTTSYENKALKGNQSSIFLTAHIRSFNQYGSSPYVPINRIVHYDNLEQKNIHITDITAHSATVRWLLLLRDDVVGYRIYKDDKVIATLKKYNIHSYSFNQLLANTTYDNYGIQVIYSTGVSSVTPITFTTLPTSLEAPKTFIVKEINDTSVLLEWEPSSQPVRGYDLWCKPNNHDSGSIKISLDANKNSYRLVNLPIDTNYTCDVNAFNNKESSNKFTFSFTTTDTISTQHIKPFAGNHIEAHWDKNITSTHQPDKPAKYYWFIVNKDGNRTILTQGHPCMYLMKGVGEKGEIITSTDSNSSIETFLQKGIYTLEVTKCDESSDNTFTIDLNKEYPIVEIPTLSHDNVLKHSAILQWEVDEDSSNLYDGFKIFSPSSIFGHNTLIATLEKNITDYQLEGLADYTTYTYYITPYSNNNEFIPSFFLFDGENKTTFTTQIENLPAPIITDIMNESHSIDLIFLSPVKCDGFKIYQNEELFFLARNKSHLI